MRIALAGPAHPHKGGVAAHTTATAHALAAAGHEVELVSWSRLYPRALYPGDLAAAPGAPDTPPFSPTLDLLRWDLPQSWWRTGARLRGFDLVVIVVVVPVHVPAQLVLARSARRAAHGPAVAAIVHNVVPHETHPGGRWLMDRMLHSMDAVLVHSPGQAELAQRHGAKRIVVAPLPAHLPGGMPDRSGPELAAQRLPLRPDQPLRVLTLGMVRDYKGYDLLLEAARAVPGCAGDHRRAAVGQCGGAGAGARR